MKMNKGDAILLCILLATFVLFAVNEFNILAGLPQYDTPAWTIFGIIFGGELLSFAIYRIGMAKYETKDEKGTIRQIEKDIEEQTVRGKHQNDKQINQP